MATSLLKDAVQANINAGKRALRMATAKTLKEAMQATESTIYTLYIEIIGNPLLMYGYLRRNARGQIEGLPMTRDFTDPGPDNWEVLDWNDYVVIDGGAPVEFVFTSEDSATYRAVL